MVKQRVGHIKLVKLSIEQTKDTSIALPVGYLVRYSEGSILSYPMTSVSKLDDPSEGEQVLFTEKQQVALLELI